jgi:hypothetical protein
LMAPSSERRKPLVKKSLSSLKARACAAVCG